MAENRRNNTYLLNPITRVTAPMIVPEVCALVYPDNATSMLYSKLTGRDIVTAPLESVLLFTISVPPDVVGLVMLT